MTSAKNKNIRVFTVPYDSGHYNERMGAGPLHILNNGLLKKLQAYGYTVQHDQINFKEKFMTEITTTFTLLEQITSGVNKAFEDNFFPIVLSGNCNATVGTIAAHNEDNTGLIWFGAHGDCETPETTKSGFLDGMALSILTGSCWQNMTLSLKKFNLITEKI